MEEIKPELSVIPSPLNLGAGNYTFKLTPDYEDILAINGKHISRLSRVVGEVRPPLMLDTYNSFDEHSLINSDSKFISHTHN